MLRDGGSSSLADDASNTQAVPSELALCALLLAVSTFLSLVLLYLGQAPQHLGGGWEVWDGHLAWEITINEAPAHVRWSGSGFQSLGNRGEPPNNQCALAGACKEGETRAPADYVDATSSWWSGLGLSFLWSRASASDDSREGAAFGATGSGGASAGSEDSPADEDSEFASEASSSATAAFAFDPDDLPLANFASTRCDFERVPARKMSPTLFSERYYLKAPVVISGGASSWPALENWRRSALQERYGDRAVRVGTARDIVDNDSDGPHEMRLCDYLRLMRRLPLINSQYGAATGASDFGENPNDRLPSRGNMLGSDLQYGMATASSVAAAVAAAGQVMGAAPAPSEFDDGGAYVQNRRRFESQRQHQRAKGMAKTNRPGSKGHHRKESKGEGEGDREEAEDGGDEGGGEHAQPWISDKNRNVTATQSIHPLERTPAKTPRASGRARPALSDLSHDNGPDQLAYLFDRDGIFGSPGAGGSGAVAPDGTLLKGSVANGGRADFQHDILDDILLPRWLLDIHNSWLRSTGSVGTPGAGAREISGAGDVAKDSDIGDGWWAHYLFSPFAALSALWTWWRGVVAWQLGYVQASDGAFYPNLGAMSMGNGKHESSQSGGQNLRSHSHFGGDTSEYSLAFQVGSNNTGLPLHMHADAFSALVYGTRHWIFYNASRSPPGYPSQRGHYSWLVQTLPSLPPHERPLQCVQYPGDILYIPETWFYATHSLGETVGMSAQASVAQTPGLRGLHDAFDAFSRGLQTSMSDASSGNSAESGREGAARSEWLGPALEMTKKAAAMVPAEAFRAFEVRSREGA